MVIALEDDLPPLYRPSSSGVQVVRTPGGGQLGEARKVVPRTRAECRSHFSIHPSQLVIRSVYAQPFRSYRGERQVSCVPWKMRMGVGRRDRASTPADWPARVMSPRTSEVVLLLPLAPRL